MFRKLLAVGALAVSLSFPAVTAYSRGGGNGPPFFGKPQCEITTYAGTCSGDPGAAV